MSVPQIDLPHEKEFRRARGLGILQRFDVLQGFVDPVEGAMVLGSGVVDGYDQTGDIGFDLGGRDLILGRLVGSCC